jgi:type I restriction enzyme S subunit
VSEQLPRGWESVRLGDLALEVRNGISAKPDGEVGTPVLRISAVRPMVLNTSDVRFLGGPAAEWEAYRLRRDDLLFTRYNGNPSLVGVCARVGVESAELLVYPDKLIRVRLDDRMAVPAFIEKAVHVGASRAFIDGKTKTSAGQVGISGGDLKDVPVLLPPLNEQRRIVAKLEALQARSRRAREALDAVPPLLEKLRQSILAAAFRGDLTKDWRAKHKDVEPASELLKRIRAERKKKWEEAELAKMKAKGKAPTDDKWKAKYKEPEPVDTSGLPELPKGWCWASVEEVTSAVRTPCYGVVQPGDDSSDGVPLVRVCDLEGDGESVAIEGLRRIPPEVASEYERSQLEGGELLISVVGTIGRTAIAPPALRGANIARAIARLVFEPSLSSTWGMYWFNGAYMWHRLNLESREVARKTLNVGQLLEMPVPVAPIGEMVEACTRIRLGLARVMKIGRATVEAAGRATSLERAMLAKAFRGELVPQDPSDEPADVMLGRNGVGTSDARAPESVAKKRGAKRSVRA